MTNVVKNIAHIISAVELQGIRLVESTVESNIRSRKDVGEIDLTIETSTQPPTMPKDEFLYVRPTISTVLSSHEKTVVSILATYELTYRLAKEIKVSQDELNDFARLNVMFNVWSYWREFVQSSLTRMNLPPVILPLFRVQEAAKQVKRAAQREALPTKG